MNQKTTPVASSITDFTKSDSIPKPEQKLPHFKVNGSADISTHVIHDGMYVKINNRALKLRYPPSIWQRFPKIHRKILADNLTYGVTFHLPFLFPLLKKMSYNLPVPLAEAFLYKGMVLSLPSSAIMQKQKEKRITSNLIRRLFDVDFIFSNKKTDIPPYNRKSLSDHAIMPFTFGKDSLLTFALARELDIRIYPVFISEPDYPYEEYVKKILSGPFRKEFGIKISFLKNTLGALREPSGWFGWELQLTQYSLMLLPYVYTKRAGYIFFSNEQSCNDTITDSDGFRCNPVYEQSHGWLLQNSLMTSLVGGNSLSIGSLLEPLNELAIEKILHTRYPEIAKYQSSCDLGQIPKHNGRWCEDCSKCGRMYIFLLAIGVDPKTVGFKHNLLSTRYHAIYALFATDRIKEYGYDQSQAGRDEQIFAFYLAYKRGIKGPLIQEFKRKYLKYAQRSERTFRKRFFGIHSSKTVPSPIRSRILQIYRNELKDLQ